MCSTQSPWSFHNVAFKTVPMCIWLMTALSHPWRKIDGCFLFLHLSLHSFFSAFQVTFCFLSSFFFFFLVGLLFWIYMSCLSIICSFSFLFGKQASSLSMTNVCVHFYTFKKKYGLINLFTEQKGREVFSQTESKRQSILHDAVNASLPCSVHSCRPLQKQFLWSPGSPKWQF